MAVSHRDTDLRQIRGENCSKTKLLSSHTSFFCKISDKYDRTAFSSAIDRLVQITFPKQCGSVDRI